MLSSRTAVHIVTVLNCVSSQRLQSMGEASFASHAMCQINQGFYLALASDSARTIAVNAISGPALLVMVLGDSSRWLRAGPTRQYAMMSCTSSNAIIYFSRYDWCCCRWPPGAHRFPFFLAICLTHCCWPGLALLVAEPEPLRQTHDRSNLTILYYWMKVTVLNCVSSQRLQSMGEASFA